MHTPKQTLTQREMTHAAAMCTLVLSSQFAYARNL